MPLRQHKAHDLPDPIEIDLSYDKCVDTINRGEGAPPINLNIGPVPKV